MKFDAIFFDLDETLYPSSSGLWLAIRERINLFMETRMGIPREEVARLREQYFREYGTTLRGLQANYTVDMEEYLAYVHDVPLERYLQPDPQLRGILAGLKARKFIFTNADCAHARRVTQTLCLDGLWEQCIDVHSIAPYCKPMPESFARALETASCSDPSRCALLDDQARVTRAARQAGMFSILVGKESAGGDADAALPGWSALPDLLERGN